MTKSIEERVARVEAYLGFSAETPAFPEAAKPAVEAPAAVAVGAPAADAPTA